MVVYHGTQKWPGEIRFSRLINGMEKPDSKIARLLERYVPDFDCHLINLTTMSDEEIRGEVTTRLLVLVLKHIFAQGLGGRLDQIIAMAAEVIRQPSGMEMITALLRYIGRAGVQVKREEVAQKLLEVLPKEGGMLMDTMAHEWIEEGIEEGIEKGILKERRDMILRILQRRFQINEERLQAIRKQLFQIEDGEILSKLADLSFDVLVLPDFIAKLQLFLPQSFSNPVREMGFVATATDRAG